MRYLSIASEPYKISYAVFENKTLKLYGVKNIDYKLFISDTLLEIEKVIKDLIIEHKVDFVLMQMLDEKKFIKKDFEKIVEYRTIIHLTSLRNKVSFVEFKTSGWEKRLLMNIMTKKRKIDTINFGYELNLTTNDEGIADAIILGEGVAHNRLQIGRD